MPSGVLGVVLQQHAVGLEGVVHPITERLAELGLGHPPVERQRRDQHHVVDAGLGGHVEHRLDDTLAHVGPLQSAAAAATRRRTRS